MESVNPRVITASRVLSPLAAIVALLWLATTLAVAHGATVTVEPDQARAGDHIKVVGADFEADAMVTITLKGIRGTIDLGEATADTDGDFSVKLEIPSDSAAGSYQLIAQGGDDSVTVAFSVSAFSTGSAGPQDVVSKRSTSETVTIGVIVVALIAAGTALVLSGTHRPPSSPKP